MLNPAVARWQEEKEEKEEEETEEAEEEAEGQKQTRKQTRGAETNQETDEKPKNRHRCGVVDVVDVINESAPRKANQRRLALEHDVK